jgi:hypothetical protein
MARWLIDGGLREHRFPLFQFMPRAGILFVLNEGGRGFTLSLYSRPLGLRVYLAGRVWAWDRL